MSDTHQRLTETELVLLYEVGFVHLVPEELRPLVCRMFRHGHFAFGDEIVREGDEPDSLYVLTSGSARVVIRRNDADVMLGRLDAGSVFGEAALMAGARRTATVRASEDVEVLRLPREAFDALVDLHPEIAEALSAHIRMQEILRVLRLHPAFSVLPLGVLSKFLDSFETLDVAAHDVIVHEGDPTDAIYAVADGRLTVSQGGTREVIGYLRVGDFFGERALLEGAARRATVTATIDSRLLRVDADTVRQLQASSPRFSSRLRELADQRDRRGAEQVPLDFVEGQPSHAQRPESPKVDGDAGTARVTKWARRGRGFPFVAQFDAVDCGVACLAMVSRHFGREVSVTFLRDAAGTGTEGTTLTGIVEAGRAAGLDVDARRVSRDRLDGLSLPAIVHWRGDHWVVLYDLSVSQARVADPAVGLRTLTRAEFEHDWTGFAATVERTADLDKAPTDDVSLRWLVPFITEHSGTLIVAFVLALLVAGCEVAVPATVQHIVAALTGKTSASKINLYGLLLVGFVIASGICLYVQRRILVRVAVGFDRSSLDFLTARLLDLPMSYFARRRTGDLERRVAGMADVRRLIVQDGVEAATAALLLVVAIILMATYSVPLALAFLATMPLYAAMMRYSRRLRPVFAAMEEAHGHYQSRQIDLLKGVETVKTLGAEPGLRAKLRETFSEVSGRVTPAYLALGRYEATVAGLTLATYAAFVYLGALAVHSHSLSLSQYVAFMALVLVAIAPLLSLMYFWDQVQVSSVLLARIHDVLAHEPEQGDRRDGLRPVTSLQGHIVVRDLEFRYRPHDQAIVSRVNLDVPPGTTVAVVGRSGSGKSTLLRLLAGLLEPTSGNISYDGVDIADVRHQELRARIGFVLQTPYIFDATVAENIAFGVHPVDDDALRKAAQIADVDSFVSRFPLGYATRIGDGGLKLSGGQAQRIAIARALYRYPPVVFFDEATSALDSEAEQAIKQNLDQLSRGRTAFIVTHRLTSIRDVDLIVVLDAGSVVETGTHDALVNAGGLYAHLYSQQFVETAGA
jgi:ABC-type bacteriocin/lantibiotic exporter with double-glycine peptidase domain/CRP-like cAMP-binding protein